MMEKSKFTSWKYDGSRGKRISKRLKNKHDRRVAKEEIRREAYAKENTNQC